MEDESARSEKSRLLGDEWFESWKARKTMCTTRPQVLPKNNEYRRRGLPTIIHHTLEKEGQSSTVDVVEL